MFLCTSLLQFDSTFEMWGIKLSKLTTELEQKPIRWDYDRICKLIYWFDYQHLNFRIGLSRKEYQKWEIDKKIKIKN